jgi:phenylacetate-CoA ligase
MPQDFQHQIFSFLMESQYFPKNQLLQQQTHQVEQLVRFARREVPFYARRLNCLFDAEDQFHFGNWHEVPILTRDDLLKHRSEMLASKLPDGHGLTAEHLGSGTTGQVLTTSHNALIGEVSQAAYYRAMSWHGIDYAKTQFSWFSADPAVDRWPEGTSTLGWGPHWDARSNMGLHLKLSRLDSVEQAVEFMNRHRPNYITGRPNTMLELAVETEKRGAKIKLDAVFSFGAELTDVTREACGRVFGAKVMNRYASKEVYDIAHQCPETTNLHICCEAMIFEVLDEQNRPCPVGVPGRAIVTPFYNTVQPIIRYDLGDIVTLGEACSCGRTLPVITALNGRTVHLFRRADGSRFSLRLPDILHKTIGAREWQVAQTGLEQIEIRFIKIAEAEQPALDYIIQTIRSQMTQRTTVSFTLVAKLPQTPSGKVLERVCEVRAEDTIS